MLPGIAVAQSSEGGAMSQEFMVMAIFSVLILMVFVLIAVIVSLMSLKKVIREVAIKTAREGEEAEEAPGWLAIFWDKLWKRASVEEERDILLDHNYDGIRELDNHLPPWWTYLFYVTIAFGVVYLLVFHVFKTQPLQIEAYNMEVAEAAKAAEARQAAQAEEGNGFDELSVQYSDDPEVLAGGENIFKMQCAACHQPDGGGLIGPNLTDKYWIHGGSMADIYRTIKVGVPDKGMISWESVLSPTKIRDVASYILTLQGTTPANPKEPQGTLYEGDATGKE